MKLNTYYREQFKSPQNLHSTLVFCFLMMLFTSVADAQTTLASYNFDNGDFTGWAYGAWGLNGDADNQCSWEFGEPSGGRGFNDIRGQRGFVGNADPTVDHTSSNTVNYVAGQGLSADSRREGQSGHYNNSSEWLQSPAISCADYYNVTLDYYRWANFEPGYDFGLIEVSTDGTNWNIVYEPTTLADNGWVKHTLDISKYADRQPLVYIRWRSESDGSVFYAGWNIDDVQITGVYNTNDYTSSIVPGNFTVPASISSLTDTYSEKVTFGEFTISDAGSGDNLPTIIDTLVLTPGDDNEIADWKKAITGIYLYEAATGQEIAGTVYRNTIYFIDNSFLTIADGSSRTYEISFYVEVHLTEATDNEQFEFYLDYGNIICNEFGSLISSGELETGYNRLVLDIEATQLTFLTEPQQLVSANRDLLPIVEVAATDENGNTDIDYSGTITINNTGGLSAIGNSEPAVNGIARFSSFQFTETGGPVQLATSHSGSGGISNATSQVSVTIDNGLSNYIYFEDFDNGTPTGWSSGSNYGSSSWSLGEPNGGRGYDDLSRRYVGNSDPTTDASTDNTTNYVYGQGLNRSSRTEGRSGHYNSSDEWLMSAAYDLTSYYNTQLHFYRWANFEPYYDSAFVEISLDGLNWIELEHTYFPSDSRWTLVSLDISAIADRQPTVYIRWRSNNDESIFYAGWNIDNVSITGIFSPITDWIGVASNDWNDPANWSGGSVPNRLSNVYIESNTPYRPVVSSTAECNEIIIKKNAILEVDYTGDLTVYGDVQIETDVSDYGALIDLGTIHILGNGVVSRYLSGNRWTYISSPVNNAVSTQFGEEIYYYDEVAAKDNWNNGWVLAENILLESAKGYDVYKHKNDIINLEGTFNSGTYGITVTNTDGNEVAEHEGWNLIGNPYPSAIDWDAAGWTKTNVNDAIYIWDQTQQNYVTYISGVGTNGGSRYIPPMQGFFVKVTNPGSGYVGMTNEVRIANTESKLKSAGSDKDGLTIRLDGYSYSDETLIRFVDGAGTNFDKAYDALKKFSDNEVVPQIYTTTGKGEHLAINSYPLTIDYSIIPIELNVIGAGDYTLQFDGVWNLDVSKTIYIEDKQLDTLINLLSVNRYSFTTDDIEMGGRFALHVGMPLMLDYSVTHVSERGASDGAIDLTVYGGIQPLAAVVWSNGAKTEDISNLAAGDYMVTITDASGNVLMDTITVNNAQNSTSALSPEEIMESIVDVYGLTQEFIIQVSDKDTPIKAVKVYDINGSLIYQSTQESYGNIRLPLSATQGVYLVHVVQGESSFTQKILLK